MGPHRSSCLCKDGRNVCLSDNQIAIQALAPNLSATRTMGVGKTSVSALLAKENVEKTACLISFHPTLDFSFLVHQSHRSPSIFCNPPMQQHGSCHVKAALFSIWNHFQTANCRNPCLPLPNSRSSGNQSSTLHFPLTQPCQQFCF